ncbi:hypothetical protein BDZ97DRAFT_1702956 [Flammula alnicola]|nr:hypothetical protein BDZ97DRAFT_1702956 [Flammula alnicola]
MDLLKSKVVPGAFHTADEDYGAPKCHPNTRVAILEEIMAWLDDTNDSRRAMWMRGAAGAGKSAIARTIAQICEEKDRLSSSFFFSRTASDTRQSDEKHLVATLTYHMVENIPEIGQHITTVMLSNPFIFDSALDRQIDKLIVAPLSRLSDDISSSSILPKIIIIDGLDECHRKDAQGAIVKGFVAAVARMQHNFPHKLLITSRPEENILAAFDDREVAPLLRTLPLDGFWKFLVDGFADIRQNHDLKRDIPGGWPAADDIDKLIEKSSGQFIYAATVIKFINLPWRRPVESLRMIIALNRPHAELDALYSHILASLEVSDLVLQILRIVLMKSVQPTVDLPQSVIPFIQNLLGLGMGRVEFALKDLSSIVAIEEPDIKFLDASLPDFLMDKTRAGKFYPNSDKICVDLLRRCLLWISEATADGISNLDRRTLLAYFAGPQHFVDNVQGAHSEIYDTFSGFDLKATLNNISRTVASLPKVTGPMHSVPYGSTAEGMANFLAWILQEHKTLSASQTPHIPLKVVSQLQEWILDQLQKPPLAGRISSSSLDNNNLEKFVGDPELSFCWSLMSERVLSALFRDIELLGAYAMNEDKYSYVALYCCHYLVSGRPKKERRPFRVMTSHASFFLQNAAPRIDLYHSLHKILKLDSMQEYERYLYRASSSDEYRTRLVSHLEDHFDQKLRIPSLSGWGSDGLTDSLVDYLIKTCKTFPSLHGPASVHFQHERQQGEGPTPNSTLRSRVKSTISKRLKWRS